MKRLSASLLTAAVFLCPTNALAAPANDPYPLIGVYAQQMMAQNHEPGLSIALTDRTHTLKIYTFGYADAAAKSPVTESTRFGIGSVSKSMTATALLLARDRHQFDPQKPVTAYLPWFSVRTKYRAITGFDLLTHTSGLPDGGVGSSPDDVYALRQVDTGFAPGAHWSYSNVGYETLGAILEHIEGTQYSTTLANRVFAPLGMTESAAVWSPETLADAASGYMYAYDDRPEPESYPLIPFPQNTVANPAGSVVSTPGDMAKYLRFILNGTLLSPSSYKLLTTASVKNGSTEAGLTGFYDHYAFGLAQQTVDGHHLVGHTGGVSRYTTCFQADLDSGFAAIAMSNLGYVGPRPCGVIAYALKVLRAQQEGKPLPAMPAPVDPLAVPHAQDYAGTFRADAGDALTFAAKDGHLVLQDGANTKIMSLRGEDAFWVDDARFQKFPLRFLRDKNHRVTDLGYGTQWYKSGAYAGPAAFPYPKAWDAYTGYYRDATGFPYGGAMHVIVFKGQLITDDGTPLTAVGGRTFRVGTDAWSPERVTFDDVVDGHAQRIRVAAGPILYRSFQQ